MNKAIDILKRNWLYLAGAVIGGIGGYLYWYYIGCNTGTCPITASPTMSMIWAAIAGGLIFGFFKREKNNEKNETNFISITIRRLFI